ncbi:NAD(P)/FAD-dependent oxidoreductase [Spirilliplanes yamanashiensis]|uniref:NADH:ubiquinone reductase (non-electrogenic) n=1 Tax=Spirilliplanes yamanashiensis TaxID=42233 RepID=A0A8J3YBU4_9ACTN|nr:NAD(P)/FAD-dependent oxidoreductase [Spirilliplanes yamanashiensis]MDP9818044.1 NADH dehydrogenase [Spirilliplanes yamanashiensis]GIJ04853.1 putative NADH dehydrogenase (NDH) [Spirilliplanes yamanashiensis]
MAERADARHRVVIVGAGFGGLFAAKALRKAPVDITLINGTSYHLFQPLLYQVATGILSEGEIAPPIREILKRQDNVDVRLGWVDDVDVEAKTVSASALGIDYTVPYDSLIVAAGASQSYFGNDDFAEYAPGMKSIDDALELRARIFGAFELADLATDPAEIERWLTFVVVGAGPTGVEMAGQIAELAHRTLHGQYRHIDPRKARVLLVDALPAVLNTFGDELSTRALRQLHLLGVEVELESKVVGVDRTGIEVETPRGRERIESMTKIWAAGVAAPALSRKLADAAGASVDRAGRLEVNPDTTVPGHPEIYAIGDMMSLDRLPGVAQVAIQSGRHAAGQIKRRLAGKETGQPFTYFDKGSMATISRFSAVASVGRLRLSGFIGWLMWLAVHLLYLVGFKNRLTAVLHWFVSFIGTGRSERVSTVQQAFARAAMREYGEPVVAGRAGERAGERAAGPAAGRETEPAGRAPESIGSPTAQETAAR